MTQIDELLSRLSSADLTGAEGALARLAIEGARTVEPLLAAYPHATDAARARMLRLLERVPDRRALPLLEATAAEGPEGLRRLAVRALGAQPTVRSLGVLARLLAAEPAAPVRAEIVGLLARMSGSEVPEALDPVLDVLFDTDEPGEVRRAALTALAGLTPRQALQLLRRLAGEDGSSLSTDVRELLRNCPEDPLQGLPALMTEPPESDASMAVTSPPMRLMNIPHVLSTLETHADDPETVHRCARALDTLSPEARRDLAGRLDPTWPLPVLDGVLDSLRGSADRQVVVGVVALIEGLAARIRDEPDAGRRQHLSARRARSHRLVAAAGSRLAIADLKEALRQTDPLAHDLVRALAAIGRPADLADLLGRHEGADPWMQEEILRAGREIVSRENPRRARRALAALPPDLAALLRPQASRQEQIDLGAEHPPRPGDPS